MARRNHLLLALLAACGLNAQEFDRIRYRDGTVNSRIIVVAEKREEITYKSDLRQAQGVNKRWSEIASITYAGQEGGYWKAGQDALQAGRYEEAATHFAALADGASREWQTAYGRFAQAEAWELAAAWAEAAKAYGLLCSALPEHRLWPDAKYRQGIALVLASDAAAAEAVIKELTAFGDANSAFKVASRARASAVQAMLAAQAGDLAKARTLEKSVRFSRGDSNTWFHWNRLWADTMAAKDQWADAAAIYEKMLAQMDGDSPAMRTTVLVNLGVALARSDKKEQALGHLLAVDALPYGSRQERARAQFTAGRLLWELGNAALPSNPKEVAAVQERNLLNQRMARLMLTTAAAGEGDAASRATEFLSTLPADASAPAASASAASLAPTTSAPATPAAAPAQTAPAPVPPAQTPAPVPPPAARPVAPPPAPKTTPPAGAAKPGQAPAGGATKR